MAASPTPGEQKKGKTTSATPTPSMHYQGYHAGKGRGSSVTGSMRFAAVPG